MSAPLEILILNKYIVAVIVACISIFSMQLVYAQVEQQVKTDLQKKLGTAVKIKSVSASPLSGIYEVQVGNDVFYTDTKSQYLIQVFSDPNCGYCKRLEKSMQQLDNVTIYTYLIPILGPDSVQKAKQIWCSADPAKTYIDWMVNGTALGGKTDCITPVDKNMALAKTYGITGTPTLFFTDGSRFPGAVQISDLEKKLATLK